MYCLLVYDIPGDRKRDKIADVCLDYGLDRIQYSAFLGQLHSTNQAELMAKLKTVLGRKPGNIQLFPLCDSDWAARRVIVQGAQDTQGGQKPSSAKDAPGNQEPQNAGRPA